MKEKKKCPRCGATEKQNKHTANQSGTARIMCRMCGKTYTPEPRKHAYSEEERGKAIKAYYECKSGRAVGRLMGMARSNAVRWIKERADRLPASDPETAQNTTESVDVIELDEMFHFLEKKS